MFQLELIWPIYQGSTTQSYKPFLFSEKIVHYAKNLCKLKGTINFVISEKFYWSVISNSSRYSHCVAIKSLQSYAAYDGHKMVAFFFRNQPPQKAFTRYNE